VFHRGTLIIYKWSGASYQWPLGSRYIVEVGVKKAKISAGAQKKKSTDSVEGSSGHVYTYTYTHIHKHVHIYTYIQLYTHVLTSGCSARGTRST